MRTWLTTSWPWPRASRKSLKTLRRLTSRLRQCTPPSQAQPTWQKQQVLQRRATPPRQKQPTWPRMSAPPTWVWHRQRIPDKLPASHRGHQLAQCHRGIGMQPQKVQPTCQKEQKNVTDRGNSSTTKAANVTEDGASLNISKAANVTQAASLTETVSSSNITQAPKTAQVANFSQRTAAGSMSVRHHTPPNRVHQTWQKQLSPSIVAACNSRESREKKRRPKSLQNPVVVALVSTTSNPMCWYTPKCDTGFLALTKPLQLIWMTLYCSQSPNHSRLIWGF